MKIVHLDGFIYYIDNSESNNKNRHVDIDLIGEELITPQIYNKLGKWMYFYNNKEFVAKMCEEAVKNHVVKEAKHEDAEKGVACFYLNYDDIDGHKRVITYFLENNLIQKTKEGRLYNISFKLDRQTLANEYGDDFHSNIKLENFINLDTGEWRL